MALSVLRTSDQRKVIAADSFPDAKQSAMLARASRATRADAGKERSGGAWMAMSGTGSEARVTVRLKGSEEEPRKLRTVSTKTNLAPPSRSWLPSVTDDAALPAARRVAATSAAPSCGTAHGQQ